MKVIRCYSQQTGQFLGWLNSYLEPAMSRIGRVVLPAVDAENLTGWHISGVSLVVCED